MAAESPYRGSIADLQATLTGVFSDGMVFDLPFLRGTIATIELVPVNANPIAEAGGDHVIECRSSAGAAVTLAGSANDPDGDALTFTWDVPAGIVLDDPLSPTPTGIFPIGITTATLTITDGNGGLDVDDAIITVEDTTPPEVACTTDLAALWPPNHQLVEIGIFIDATDACAAPEDLVLLSVTISSNEPDNALGDGDTGGDVDGMDGYTSAVDVTPSFTFNDLTNSFEGSLSLRAERDGAGTGRTYTIEAVVIDTWFNLASTSCVVVVPHEGDTGAEFVTGFGVAGLERLVVMPGVGLGSEAIDIDTSRCESTLNIGVAQQGDVTSNSDGPTEGGHFA